VVEVASPGTAVYDRLSKARAYARAEVEEYWIVDPQAYSYELLSPTI
jgi:Uma2 family endonuclease